VDPLHSDSNRATQVQEYDVYVKMPVEYAHLLGYLSEAEDHIMNIRHADNDEKAVKIIVPSAFLQQVLDMLESLKEEFDLVVLRYEPNPGHP